MRRCHRWPLAAIIATQAGLKPRPVRRCAPQIGLLRNGIIKALTALVLLGTLALSGCGTLMARASNQYISYDFYKGTQQNIQLLTMRGARGYDGYATIYCWMSIVCPLVAVVSLPVDAAVDTVLLPYDAKGVYY
jgi:uncharacterized protein YceK